MSSERCGKNDGYSVFGIHLGQNRDGKQGRLGILLSLMVIKSAVRQTLRGINGFINPFDS